MKRLLMGTTNLAKLEEVRGVLAGEELQILGLKDFLDIQKVEETGDTFEENAALKAKGYFVQTGIPTIADDGGLLVDALGGLPGVHSHRWLGYEAKDEELAAAVLERMKEIPREKRTARLGGVIVFYDGQRLLYAENWVEGYIADRLLTDIQPGFPYRPIFVIKEFDKPYSGLSPEELAAIGHRRKSLQQLKPKILEILSGEVA